MRLRNELRRKRVGAWRFIGEKAAEATPVMNRSRWLVALLAILTRLALAVSRWNADDPAPDPDGYRTLALALAEGRGFVWNDRPTAYRPPLYPLTLVPLVALAPDEPRWVWPLHALMGAITAVLILETARRWGLGPRASLGAGLIVALDPVLVAQAPLTMTETLAALLVALGTWLAALAERPARSLGLGMVLGLAALCRPSLLPCGLLIVVARAFPTAAPGSRKAAALILLGLVGTLSPWAIRNHLAVGGFILTTTHGGYTLALANNPVYYAEVLNGPAGAVWSGPNQAAWFREINTSLQGLSEPEADAELTARTLRFIAEHPREFVRASLARWGRFWAFAPSSQVFPRAVVLATACWSLPLLTLAALGLTRPTVRRWPGRVAIAWLVGLSLVHLVYWTDLRMRAPLTPVLALLASLAVNDLAGWRTWTPHRNPTLKR